MRRGKWWHWRGRGQSLDQCPWVGERDWDLATKRRVWPQGEKDSGSPSSIAPMGVPGQRVLPRAQEALGGPR